MKIVYTSDNKKRKSVYTNLMANILFAKSNIRKTFKKTNKNALFCNNMWLSQFAEAWNTRLLEENSYWSMSCRKGLSQGMREMSLQSLTSSLAEALFLTRFRKARKCWSRLSRSLPILHVDFLRLKPEGSIL